MASVVFIVAVVVCGVYYGIWMRSTGCGVMVLFLLEMFGSACLSARVRFESVLCFLGFGCSVVSIVFVNSVGRLSCLCDSGGRMVLICCVVVVGELVCIGLTFVSVL